jgi:hypothetical protein
MHFGTKSTLKSNHNHTLKQTRKGLRLPNNKEHNRKMQTIQKVHPPTSDLTCSWESKYNVFGSVVAVVF